MASWGRMGMSARGPVGTVRGGPLSGTTPWRIRIGTAIGDGICTFLYVETNAGHMHVAMTGVYDVSTMPNGYSFEAFRSHMVRGFIWCLVQASAGRGPVSVPWSRV